jgi:hypothetical protein
MKFTTTRSLLFEVMFAVLLLVGTVPNAAVAASPPKVEVCHIPPGNPANFHTITISPSALPAHLAHGDFPGACDKSCAVLCNDGNACTIDDTGDCETKGCPVVRAPVDCSDGNLCTTDTCDPKSGCINTAVTCNAPDLCTVSACAPDTGQCVDTPFVCPEEDQTCNPATGLCEAGPDPECEGQTCATFTTCNEGGSCGSNGVCGSTAEGGGLCVDRTTSCGGLTGCPNGSSDCAPGDICVVDSCCFTPVCVPSSTFCSDPAAGFTALRQASPTTPGATIGKP